MRPTRQTANPQPSEPNASGIHIRCTAAFKARLQSYCQGNRWDMSELIRHAVTEYLERAERAGK